jgi:signal transduction histidine kinase/CheY-like chemotaxis protein
LPADRPRRAVGIARVGLLLLIAAVLVPMAALVAVALLAESVPAWTLLAVALPMAAVLLVLGTRALDRQDRPGGGTASAPAAAPDGGGATSPRLTSPLAIEELRGEIERYRVLERQLTHAKQEAEAAALSKNEFLATVSHEIRTPLNGIIPLLAMLRDTRLDAEQADLVVTAQQSAKQLLAIVDDILDYSKIEANKLELESVDLAPSEIVEQVARMMGPMAEAKRLRFSSTIDPGANLRLRGDPVRLRQVLTNLVSNAIKFTERGEVVVEVSRVAETRSRAEIQFVVKDTGIGISPQAQQRLFKSFSQADASTTRVHGGTGLGLAICRRLVELMGGQIGVKSEAGRGSAFWFRVPLPRVVAAGERTRDLEGMRAMVVSGDRAFVTRYERMLGGFSMTTMSHAGGPDLVGNLRGAAAMGPSWRVDVAVVDAAGLGMQAAGLARALLRDSALRNLAVLLVGADPRSLGDLRDARLATVARDLPERALRDALLRLLEGEGEALPPAPAATAPALLAAADRARASAPSPTPVRSATPAAAPVDPPGRVAAKPAAATNGQGTTAPRTAGAGARILLVEDNPVNRQLAQKLLTMAGHRVETAENGQLALEALAAGPFDIVLMDCQMPVLDGYAATRRIRELQKAGKLPPRLPIVAMTANAMIGDREKCLDAGMDDYLTKPLDRALMLERVSHHLAVARQGAVAPSAASADRAAGPAQPSARPAATRVVEAQGPAVDQAVLKDLLDVMGQALTDLVRVYLEDAPRLLAQLREAALADDVAGLVAPAHSLKSSSANLGAARLSDQARMIEHGARLKTLAPPLLPAVERIEAEFDRVRRELSALIDAGPD